MSVGGNSPILDSKYRDYNDKYKLVELASMTEVQRTQVSPDMSVKALRDISGKVRIKTNRSALIEKLKEIQKKGEQR